MKAIETYYKNYRFRSRLEARYAVFFDALDLQWDYEMEGFDFQDGDLYLPDFFLSDLGIFVEVKGEFPTAYEVRLCRKLQFHTGFDVMLCSNLPDKNDSLLFSSSESNGGCLTETWVRWIDLITRDVSDAAIAAKQARFEHGERPNLELPKKHQFEYIPKKVQTSELYKWYQQQQKEKDQQGKE